MIERQIADLIREIAGGNRVDILQGIVHENNGDGSFSVEIDRDDEGMPVVIPVVSSNVVSGDSGLQLTPEPNSPVVIGRIDNGNSWQLIQATRLKAVRLRIGNTIAEATEHDIVINEGKLGGMVKVQDLTAKLANLETKYNTLLIALNAIITPPPTTPFAPFFAACSPVAPLTTRADLENPKIKH